ncbi:MAG TPA: DNA polymerase IV [Steroidobacteraceae bacterium]|nr:DNA polymerase IV [Steroidobacteraceae bacterium]
MGSGRERAILHVDMDAFYASIEERDEPALRGKPVIVGGTSGRGVVAAANYVVRRFGVHSAMPMGRALQLCPQAICIAPRMSHYQAVSREVFAVFHEITPLVEGLSLDEAFLDVTASRALHGDEVAIARTIKARILERTQLKASVGVAPNKLVAKIASDLEKPDSLTVITAAELPGRLDALPIRRLPGLGRKKGDEVERAGIGTLGELRRAPDAVLWPLFGRDTRRMRERAGGIDDRPVVPDREDLSISAEETFDTDLADPARLEAELLALADRASARLRRKELAAGCVAVKVRRADFATFTRQQQLEPPTQDSRVIGRAACDLLRKWRAEHPRARVRLLGVGVTGLAPATQLDLFAAGSVPQPPPLDSALDAIRERFGSSVLTRASGLPPGKRKDAPR